MPPGVHPNVPYRPCRPSERLWAGRRAVAVLLLGVFWMCPATTLGQSIAGTLALDPQAEAERFLLQTDRVIEQAQEQVRDGGSAQRATVASQAQEILRSAVGLQRTAWTQFRELKFKRSVQFSDAARQRALKAMDMNRVEFKAHESLLSLLDQTREMAIEARGLAGGSSGGEAGHLLETGLQQLQRADESYRDRRYRLAIRLAVIARDLIGRALETIRGQGADGIDQLLDRTDALLLEVDEALEDGQDRAVAGLARQARDLQEEAREARRSGRILQAQRFTRLAREKALAVLLRLQEAPRREDLEAGLDLLHDIFADLRSEVADLDDVEAQRHLAQGAEHLGRAREFLGEGKLREAQREARAAEALLHRITDRLPSP